MTKTYPIFIGDKIDPIIIGDKAYPIIIGDESHHFTEIKEGNSSDEKTRLTIDEVPVGNAERPAVVYGTSIQAQQVWDSILTRGRIEPGEKLPPLFPQRT